MTYSWDSVTEKIFEEDEPRLSRLREATKKGFIKELIHPVNYTELR